VIKADEEFEDLPDYGARQLMELGFGTNDLLISTTEGGETPFVIGATEKATEVSTRAPYFLYCNPDEILIECVERSRRVIDNERIRKLNLTVGPMAISGSTRMQSTTILMFAVGLALFHYEEGQKTTPTEWRSGEHTALAKELNALIVFEQLVIAFCNLFEKSAYTRKGVFLEADEDFAFTS
jgi:N-acetylmuramic acid 6-phosphate etherase